MNDRSVPRTSEAAFEVRLDNALRASHAISRDTLDANEKDVIVRWIVDTHAAPAITVQEDTLHLDDEPPVSLSSGAEVPTNRLVFVVQATGATSALPDCETVSRRWVEPHNNADDTTYLSSTMELDPEDELTSERLTALCAQWIGRLDDLVGQTNNTIERERSSLEAAVRGIVEPLHDRRRRLVAAATGAGIPLTRVDATKLGIPLAPKVLSLRRANAAAERGASEFSLSEEIADELVEMVAAFSAALEQMPQTADQLVGRNEESIRDVLLFLFNANWRGAATGETFIGGGKSDILLRWRDRDAFIGECKFWRGEKAFANGLTQLLERYTVWRATRIAMVLFIRDVAAPTDVIEKASAVIRNHGRFLREIPGSTPPAFELRAQHDRKRVVTLNLVTVVLPRQRVDDTAKVTA